MAVPKVIDEGSRLSMASDSLADGLFHELGRGVSIRSTFIPVAVNSSHGAVYD